MLMRMLTVILGVMEHEDDNNDDDDDDDNFSAADLMAEI